MINRLQVQLLAVHCQVSTWMGDCLCMGKPSRYVTGHIGQLSLPSLRGRQIKYQPLASRKKGGHNKTGSADHIAKKFVASIPDIIGSLCSKFGDNWFIFKEVTTKTSMDPSLRIRD